MDKDDVVHIYNGYYSAIKENETIPFEVIWTDLEMIILSDVRQTERNKYDMILLICGI